MTDLVVAVDRVTPFVVCVCFGLWQVLSNYLAYRYSQDPDYIKNKTIVELGSGTGLVGLVAGLLEPEARIWITDQVYVGQPMLLEKNKIGRAAD